CRCCGEETPHRRDDWDGDRCIPCNERQLTEIRPKEGESMPAYAVRLLEMDRLEKQKRALPVIGEKSFLRKCRKLRKELEFGLGALRRGSDPPINVEDPAFVEHMRRIEQTREKDFEK